MSALYVGTLPDGTDIKLEIFGEEYRVAVRDMVTRRWGPEATLHLEPIAGVAE